MSYNAKNYTEQGGAVTHIGGSLIIEENATVSGLPETPMVAATATTLGGIKVGSGLSISNGVLSVEQAGANAYGSVKQAENQAELGSDVTTVAAVKSSFNTLLAALKTAGIMVADTQE